ncbi:hypothetical protein F9L06_10095 [Brucella anthropi]|uniref:Uncharacterized protein n=1 Tax=Brucella anthropi TaxID=529 RepID=A0A6I0DUC6_BRUAN|nr:hypothetical protein [Brucella anthropi]KAB2798946.1 hypothetical protein F9L06_10095 [Brucella anthropi]
MQRISIPYLFDTMMKLEALTLLHPGPRNSMIYAMFTAEYALDGLLNQSLFKSNIRSSRNAGYQLSNLLKGQLQNQQMHEIVDQYALAAIVAAYQSFKAAFLAELGVFPSYFVTQKAGFDTDTLLTNGSAIFPADLFMKVPESILDANEAGKALAFELSTACGFHTFRVVESVLRRYYKSVSGGKDVPTNKRSLGGILSLLKNEEIGDPNVLAALQQIKDLHRNPLAHPDVSLGPDEAISLIGMSQSVITFMLKEISQPETLPQQGIAQLFSDASKTAV